MSCAKYKLLISRYLDDDLSLRERDLLLTHLMNCPVCAATLARYRGIEASLRKLPESQPSEIVRENLLRLIKQDGVGTGRDGGYWGRLALAFNPPHFAGISIAAAPVVIVLALAGLLAVYVLQTGLISSGNTVASAALEPVISIPLASEGLPKNRVSVAHTPTPRNPYIAVALEQMLSRVKEERPVRLPLPAYIPAGMQLERFSLRPGVQEDNSEDMEVAFRARDGKMVRIRHSIARTVPITPESARRMIVRGQEWWVERHPTLRPDVDQAYIVFTIENDEVVVLDAVLPFEELMRVVESIKWTEEEK